MKYLKGGKNYYTITEKDITDEQAEEMLRQFSESKQTMHSFLKSVVIHDDTTKTGFVSEEELGHSKNPIRTYKELELFCEDVLEDNAWSDYFKKMSEVQTSTSLSKEGFLMKLVNTMRKELADVSPKSKTKNKGWFKSKNTEDQPTV